MKTKAIVEEEICFREACLEAIHGAKENCWSCVNRNRYCTHERNDKIHVLCRIDCAWPEVENRCKYYERRK